MAFSPTGRNLTKGEKEILVDPCYLISLASMSIGSTSCLSFSTFFFFPNLRLSMGFTTMPTSNGVETNLQPQTHHICTGTNPILPLLTLILPVLLALLDLKFQNEHNSVFQAHPIIIKAAVANFLVFALAVGIDFTFHSSHLSPTCSNLLSTTIMFCGSLSVASLASLLFPDVCRPLIYLIYLLLSLGNLHGLIRKWCRWVHQEIMVKLQTVFAGIQQWYVRRNAPLLPLTMRDIHHRAHLGINPQPQLPQSWFDLVIIVVQNPKPLSLKWQSKTSVWLLTYHWQATWDWIFHF